MNRRNDRSLLLGILATLVAIGCDGGPNEAELPLPATVETTPTVTIMTFNVENLFDNVNDPGKDDKTYLPIEAKGSEAHVAACGEIGVEFWRNECLYLDWSDAVIEHKLETLAQTIMQVDAGRGPDIIALQEVENASILDRLSFNHLREANYGPAILIEGQDNRGIDVAFLSRLPQTEPPILHPLEFPDYPERQGDTRGVLQATFLLPDGAKLTGFSVHFPAPYHPLEMRERAFQHLNGLRALLPNENYVFAAGDFNTTSTEDREKAMFDRLVRPDWELTHDHCSGCAGTYYYARDDNWSFLDTILFAPTRGKKTTWRLRKESVHLANRYPPQVDADGTPRRYDSASGSGVSDHWPLVVTIEPAGKQ